MPTDAATSSLASIAVEILVRCRACDGVVPVNRFGAAASCDACGRTVDLTDDTWGLVLREAAGDTARAEGEERAAIVESGQATLRCVFRRTAPHCLLCREPLPLGESAGLVQRGVVFCIGCGARVPLRALPISAAGLHFVVGEEEERKAASETKTLPCGGCGAPLPIDGTNRTVRCTYCKASSSVPEELWRAFRPHREVRRWFLVFAGGEGARPASASVTWQTVADVAVDAEGNVYFVGRLDESDAETAVWSVTPDMTLRWAKRSLSGLPHQSARLFHASKGRIGVWYPGGRVVAFLDASNGETRSTYPSPGGAHSVPIERCSGLAQDFDGSLVATIQGRAWGGQHPHCIFVRFTESGEVVDLWPDVPSPAPPELGETIPDYRSLASHPTWIAGAPELALGWDGTLYVYGGIYGGLGWARIARNGFLTYERVPTDSSMRIAGDRRGWLHILGRGEIVVTDHVTHLQWKLNAKDGPAGLAEERLLAVSPTGEVMLVGDAGRFRRLGAKGAVLFASEASRRADQAGHKRGWS